MEILIGLAVLIVVLTVLLAAGCVTAVWGWNLVHACRTAPKAEGRVRHASAPADFWRRRGPSPPRDIRTVRVVTAPPTRPSVWGPLASVAVIVASVLALAEQAEPPSQRRDTPTVFEFVDRVRLLPGVRPGDRHAAHLRLDRQVIADLIAGEGPTQAVAWTGLRTLSEPDQGPGPTVTQELESALIEAPDDQQVWSPLLWPYESFVLDTSGRRQSSVASQTSDLEDNAIIRLPEAELAARAGKRFGSPDEALRSVIKTVALDPALATTEGLEPHRLGAAVEALEASTRRLAVVRRPLEVEGSQLGEVYRVHVAVDRERFSETFEKSLSRHLPQGDPRRLLVVAALVSAGTLALGWMSRRA